MYCAVYIKRVEDVCSVEHRIKTRQLCFLTDLPNIMLATFTHYMIWIFNLQVVDIPCLPGIYCKYLRIHASYALGLIDYC